MTDAIIVDHLSHSFGTRRVLDDLSFQVPAGQVFGLLGPNGAGKTTTVRLLNGLYHPERGNVRVLGLDSQRQGQAVRARCGVLTETPALYERLTAVQNLTFFGKLNDMPPAALNVRIAELLAFFGLEERANEKVGSFSKGMKQRLALARALLNRPEVLFLDEPTAGLDPESALQVRELIDSTRQRDGHTVFLCTHLLNEAERLCDRLAILKNGRLLALGTLNELRQRLDPGRWVQVDLLAPVPASVQVRNLPGVLQASGQERSLRFQAETEMAIPGVVTALVQAGAKILRIQPETVSLEQMYFQLQQQAPQTSAKEQA
jgi:ABC-2 type transport system ATP-binding protein